MFAYFMPTEVVSGRGCVRAEGGKLKALGRHALIVAGNSAKKNGALNDVTAALLANGQKFTLFGEVTPNPTVPCIRRGIAALKACGADFVIGVGGGSRMDAAKAIALLAVEERDDTGIFAGGYGNAALPTVQIPTTAGTGSEVTQYAILTDDVHETKTNVSSPALFARLAYLDGAYTATLPKDITVNTAIDAFSHAAESLLSKRSNALSSSLAKESLKALYPLLPCTAGRPNEGERDGLLYASMLAGMAIAQTGTTAVHGMGYCLTYFCGVEHGRANGLLLGETLRLCAEKGTEELKALEQACGAGAEEIARLLDDLLGEREKLERDLLLDFAARSAGNKNIAKSAYEPTPEEVERIFLRSFGFRC